MQPKNERASEIDTPAMGAPKARLSIRELTFWTCGFGLLLTFPAWYFTGTNGLVGLSLAAFLCLIPGWLVFLIYSRYGDPSKVAIGFLIGTGLRLAFVLCGFLIVEFLELFPSRLQFIPWLVILFLYTLLIETWLLVRYINAVSGSDKAAPNDQPDGSRKSPE